MKTACILLTTVAFGSLTLVLCYAGEPSKLPAEREPDKNHATSVRPANRDQVERKHSPSNDSGHATERSSLAAPIHTQIKRPPGNELHQPGLKKAGTGANAGWMNNRTGNHHEQPARLAVGSGGTELLPGVVRSGNAGAMTIGGVTTFSAKRSAAALNGTTIKRKP
jgi:hypothetical protein